MARIKRDYLKPVAPKSEGDGLPIGGVSAKEEGETDFFDVTTLELPTVACDDDEKEANTDPVPPPKAVTTSAGKAVKTGPKTVSLGEPRKLTRKAQDSLKGWRSGGTARGHKMDDYMKSVADQARLGSGHTGVFLGSESKQLVVSFPVPAFAFEFVIANQGFPMGLVWHLVSTHGTGKSGLLAEIARWHDLAGGGFELKENETKFNPPWYESIMGQEAFERMVLTRCNSVEDWQKAMTDGVKIQKKMMDGTKDKPGPGRTFPILFGVDSIMGKMSDDSQESIRKEGSASRGFPVEALKITRYMKTMPQWLDGWPFSVVLVNHLKLDKNPDTGQDVRNMAGGKQTLFQESFELELRRVGPKVIESSEWDGFQVEISCAKNSFGPTHRSIVTRVLWWEELDEETGEFKQKTIWDWDWAMVRLLWSIMEGNKEKNIRLRKYLKEDGFDMGFKNPGGHVDCQAWSKAAGVSEKDPLSYSEMGAKLRNDPKLMALLRRALRIRSLPQLEGDYLASMAAAGEGMP